MARKWWYCNFILLFILSGIACSGQTGLRVTTVYLVTATGKEIPVQVEIADTEETRMKGFMGRETIPGGTGMLFLFERDEKLSFWMKDTPCPLSIAYIDSTGVIRDIYDMTPFSLASWESTVSVRYALEVPQGWFAQAGVSTGDRLRLPIPAAE